MATKKSEIASPLDKKSTPELIASALTIGDIEENAYWDIVWKLCERGTAATLNAARDLCGSDEPKERALGAHILGHLGVLSTPEHVRPFTEEALIILLPMLDEPRNADPELLQSLIGALGHQSDPRTVAAMARFKDHAESDVRWSIAVALGGQEDELSIATLIEMSRDENAGVRDWATFGIGTQIATDTPEIRMALLQRLDDPDNDTRNEAIRGLAQRKDKRVIESIIRELAAENPQHLAVEAARELAAPDLLPALLRLKAADTEADLEDETLDEAIAQCRGDMI